MAPAGMAEGEITRVVIDATFPHDPTAFTQGLLFHEGRLFESLGGYGTSAIREVELATGRVLRERRLDDRFFGEGLTLLPRPGGPVLAQLTWREERGFLHHPDTLEQVGEFRYQGEGWGLTMGPEHLHLTQGGAEILALDPQTFQIRRRLPVTLRGKPVPRLNELEWIGDRLWANIWQTSYIAVIHPSTGQVERLLDCTPLEEALPEEVPPADAPPQARRDVLNGIAFNAQDNGVYLTGKRWPRIFRIRLP